MAAALGTALRRSVLRYRVQEGLLGRRPGPAPRNSARLFSFSAPSGSTPPSTNKDGLTKNKGGFNESDYFKAKLEGAAEIYCYTLLIGMFFMYSYGKSMDKINEMIDAASRQRSYMEDEMHKGLQSIRDEILAACDSEGKQIEARKVMDSFSESQSMQVSGQSKEKI
ncbi:hypothetical protein ACP70R_008947 [Stipagrostis hirtigluma subsp. patula]